MSFRKVLVLDPSRAEREMLRGILVAAGYDAETADDDQTFTKALEWWRPDALVVDVDLDAKDGLDAPSAIARARAQRIVSVVMGARTENSLTLSAEELGADGVFSTLSGYKGVQATLTSLAELKEKRARAETDKALDW